MAGTLSYEHQAKNNTETPNLIGEIKKSNTPTDYLISKIHEPIEGKYIDSIDKKGIEELFKEIKADSVPAIFVEKIPDDFNITSVADQTLFMKLITPHILRVNEMIMKERKIILILDEKIKNNEQLSTIEETFLSRMIEKYDVIHLKEQTAQITELIKRVDIIPVSLGMAVAIWATNWGQKEKDSPFFEHAWDKNVQYTPIKFNKLSEATESFALQINSRSQLSEARATRAHFRLFENPIFGQYLVYGIRNYAHFIPSFVDQLRLVYSLGYIKEMDAACFEKGCELTK